MLGNRRTAREPDELLTAVLVPSTRGRGGGRFLKLGGAALPRDLDRDGGAGGRAGGRPHSAGRAGSRRLLAGRAAAAGGSRSGWWRAAGARARAAGGRRLPGAARADRRRARDGGLPAGRLPDPAAARPDGGSAHASGWRPEVAGVAFTVNGRAVAVEAAPFRRLADVLREDLGLTGTKVGCNAGDCGACTVLLDGEQVCACLVPLGQARGSRGRRRSRGWRRDRRSTALQRGVPGARGGAVRDLHAGHAGGGGRPARAGAAAGAGGGRGRAGGGLVPLHRLPEDRRRRCWTAADPAESPPAEAARDGRPAGPARRATQGRPDGESSAPTAGPPVACAAAGPLAAPPRARSASATSTPCWRAARAWSAS